MTAAIYDFEVLQRTFLAKSVVWENDAGTPTNTAALAA